MLATVAIGLVQARLSPGPQPAASTRAIDGASKTGAVWSPMLLRAAKIIATGFALWLIPLAALLLRSHERGFWTSLSFFFTRTACVTFGGSYTVIPYVAHAAVGKYHWLAHTEMLDGFSLAESTPGPLIIVVAYVGFMAAFHHFHGSIAMGTVGLAVATFCTFLPCFVFVLAGAPFAEIGADSQTVKRILQLVTAVVLAAMLDLAVFLGRGVLFVSGSSRAVTLDWIAAAWLVCVMVMLMKHRSSLGVVFSLSAGLGIARWWLHV
jgi:chromate transporter